MAYSYSPGEEVEVMMEEKGLENSFFPAVIVSKVGRELYQVEYLTLLKLDKSGRREVIQMNQLRPKPPHVPVTSFTLYEDVDVYENKAWWAGIYYGKSLSGYFFYHPGTRAEKCYSFDRFRMHHEWKDGRWICNKNATK